MLELKYSAPRIGTMDQAEVTKVCKTLLLKIHIITGWSIPDNELMILLVDQFSKKLIESYFDLNADEIEYSFRQAGTVIEDWGKGMNLNLLDKVLIPYINQRVDLSMAEERSKEPPPQKIYTEQETENQYRKDIEDCYQRMRIGRVPLFIPGYFKDILVKDKLMKEEDNISDFFVTRLGKASENIYVPAL